MGRNWEDEFNSWAQPPADSENERCERVIRAIKSSIKGSTNLSSKMILTFTQGSFRNRVNVKRESDVDIGIMLHDHFISEYPEGMKNADFGNTIGSYTFSQFKDDVGEALSEHFGSSSVTRGNKAFKIKATSAQVEADAVPLFEFRQYWTNGSYRAGVALFPDNRSCRIENYPERLLSYWPSTPLHYENGVAKNDDTNRRYKGMVRILKKLRVELEDKGNIAAKSIPGYLLECLCWNAPNYCYSHHNLEDRVQSILRFIWQNTKESSQCNEWLEVDNIKYLFHSSQSWTQVQAHSFVNTAWDYVGVKEQ